MSVFAALIIKLGTLVSFLLSIYTWVIIINALLSWIRPDPYNPIVRFISRLVDPVTYRISSLIPTRVGMVDLAPLILIVVVQLVQAYLLPALIGLLAGIA